MGFFFYVHTPAPFHAAPTTARLLALKRWLPSLPDLAAVAAARTTFAASRVALHAAAVAAASHSPRPHRLPTRRLHPHHRPLLPLPRAVVPPRHRLSPSLSRPASSPGAHTRTRTALAAFTPHDHPHPHALPLILAARRAVANNLRLRLLLAQAPDISARSSHRRRRRAGRGTGTDTDAVGGANGTDGGGRGVAARGRAGPAGAGAGAGACGA